MNNTAKIVLVDDHVLLRNGLATLVTSLGYTVMYECSNGKQLIEKISRNNEPDLVLMDINMPELDGFETTLWLKKNYPLINVLALSMYDNESSIIRMIKNGARGYILKDTDPTELKQAISSVISKGFYYSDLVSGRLIRAIRDDEDDEHDKNYSCSDFWPIALPRRNLRRNCRRGPPKFSKRPTSIRVAAR